MPVPTGVPPLGIGQVTLEAAMRLWPNEGCIAKPVGGCRRLARPLENTIRQVRHIGYAGQYHTPPADGKHGPRRCYI